MQAKKRYILVFVSCAFLAYCYFGGYRLKRARVPTFSASNVRRQQHIVIPANLPSFLSSHECNGIDDIIGSNDSGGYSSVNAKISNGIATHTRSHNNDDAFRQGSQVSAATVQTNAKLKGMFYAFNPHFCFCLFIISNRYISTRNHTNHTRYPKYVDNLVNSEPLK